MSAPLSDRFKMTKSRKVGLILSLSKGEAAQQRSPDCVVRQAQHEAIMAPVEPMALK